MKKLLVTVVGVALIAGGLALMPLPGPGFLVVVAGLGVMATQYEWARKLLAGAKEKAWTAQREAVSSPGRLALTVVGATATIALGASMITVDDVDWPVWDSLLDTVWSPVTGGGLVLGGLVVLGTTAYTWRRVHRESRGVRRPPHRERPAAGRRRQRSSTARDRP